MLEVKGKEGIFRAARGKKGTLYSGNNLKTQVLIKNNKSKKKKKN